MRFTTTVKPSWSEVTLCPAKLKNNLKAIHNDQADIVEVIGTVSSQVKEQFESDSQLCTNSYCNNKDCVQPS